MNLPTVFDTCEPREDVLKGTIADADFAADLAKVIRGIASDDYQKPDRFFANTYPTEGLKNLLRNVLARLTGDASAAAAIFRLDTSYGGGKTHGLIALTHAANGMKGVANVAEFVDPKFVPKTKIRIAAFDGENADPANGRSMGDGVLAHTPWGELAYSLAGKAGYDRVRKSDETHTAPGAETLAELFGGEPSPHPAGRTFRLSAQGAQPPRHRRWRTTQRLPHVPVQSRRKQPARLAGLHPRHRQGRQGRRRLQRREPVHRRQDGRGGKHFRPQGDAPQPDRGPRNRPGPAPPPVRQDRRRQGRARHRSLPLALARQQGRACRRTRTTRRPSTPSAPATRSIPKSSRRSPPRPPRSHNFQRVRGMLRLLARTIAQLWQTRPAGATAIHLHHIDLGL